MLSRAHVIKADQQAAVTPLLRDTTARHARASVVLHARLEAEQQAQALLAEANKRAVELLSAAEQQAAQLGARAEQVGLEQGLAQAISATVHLAQTEATRDEQALGRVVDMARLLAERIIGDALQLDAGRVSQMAQAALAEVRGAKRVRFYCHAADLQAVQAALGQAQVGPLAVEVLAREGLNRGDFRLETDVGVLQATLGSRLDLLCRTLQERLRP
jgi:flagellar biosynthesis/type III secretory pathway protein FliH